VDTLADDVFVLRAMRLECDDGLAYALESVVSSLSMMRSVPLQLVATVLAFAAIVPASGCKKAGDPAYLAGIESAAEAMCKCVDLPDEQAIPCRKKHAKGAWPDKSPTGEPTGLYEESLNSDSRDRMERARSRFEKCSLALIDREKALEDDKP
jgi:hypothetical protein